MPIDMVQKFIVELDSMSLLEQYLKLAINTVLNSQEELAVKVVDRNEKYLSLHLPPAVSDQEKNFPVIFISGWYLSKKNEKNSYFGGYGPWTTFSSKDTTSIVDDVIKYIKELSEKNWLTWRTEFKKKFGDGYNGCFSSFDGSVDLGYEIRGCNNFPEWLAISIVHMYYGK